MTTTITELVMRLVAAGAGPIDAASVVAEAYALGAATLPVTLPITLPVTRSRKAVNQARYREKLKQMKGGSVALAASSPATPAVTEPVTDGNTVTRAPLSILSSSSTSQGIQEGKEEKKQEVLNTEPRAKPKRGSRLPDDWEPSAIDREYAAGRGLRLVEIEIEATKFRNYWTNRTDRQASKPRWDRAWENWILNVRKPNAQGQSVIAAADRLIDKIAEFERGDEPDLLGDVRSGAGAPHVRLLSAK